MAKTITFDEQNNAWTSFHSYEPEWMASLGNNFYTFKNGNLYIHESDNVPRTQFYGTDYGLNVTFSSNQSPSEVKLYKAIMLESNSKDWYAELDSSQESGVIGGEDNLKFTDKEDMKYAYIRRKESDKLNFNELSIVGLGELQSIDPANHEYTFSNAVIAQVNTNDENGEGGDELYYESDGIKRIGIIDSVSYNSVVLTGSDNVPQIGDFCFVVKNASAESYGLRGYHTTITLTNKSTDFVELFASNAEVIKSAP